MRQEFQALTDGISGVAQLRDDRVGAIQKWLPQNPRGGGHWDTTPTTGAFHECATPNIALRD